MKTLLQTLMSIFKKEDCRKNIELSNMDNFVELSEEEMMKIGSGPLR